MRVVSDTSPISNLAIIGRLELLKQRYGTVRIPPAVALELSALSHPGAKARITAAMTEGWLVTENVPPCSPQMPFPLDAGETEAIGLAMAPRADVLLMDERRGREVARRNGLVVAGLLGELLYARLAGKLPSLRPELDRLRSDAGFFVDREIERFILSQADE
jgi:predicted nucleic acid-binding protein